MRGISFWFLASAAVYVLAGVVFGVWMSASQDHTLAPVHGHLNLIGWVSMAIFGFFYHLVPAAGESRLATIHFWIMTAAIWVMVPGIAMAIQGEGETLAKIGSLLAVLGMATFVAVVFRSRRQVA